MSQIPVFDGHNDTVLSLQTTGRSFFDDSETGHIDLPRARRGGLAGGFFAIWVPDPEEGVVVSPSGNIAPPPPRNTADAITLEDAEHYALESLATLTRVALESDGAIAVVRSTSEIRRNLEQEVLSMELHLEGAEPIDPGLNTLEAFYQAGIRSIGLVWSRCNAFAHGVPFAFPGSPDIGDGLTDAGKALVAACDQLGIMIDMSHLNEAGFWDVARLSKHPLVCTHSGVHAISASPRNLTDRQIDAIRDSEGVVGVNFHVGFLRPDGQSNAEATTVSAIADHVDYLCERMGPERVALGSDFDGATMPGDLHDVAGLPKLFDELISRGHDEATLRGIAFDNWLNVLDRIWRD